MVLNYLDPNLIIDDDDYLTDVLCYGDCVSQLSHKGALDAMSVKNQFKMNGREQDLIDLLDKGYPSIGCEPCTRAVKPGEDLRAGRWWWEQGEHKECGLHIERKRTD